MNGFTLAIAIVLASIPAIVWGLVFFDTKDPRFKTYLSVFALGTLTVVPILAMQITYFKITGKYPDADFVGTIKDFLLKYDSWIIGLYAFVGLTEELVKFYIVRYIDNTHPETIKSIGTALKFGILSALGFAFSENILYFYNNYNSGIFGIFMFRSVYTVCAHLMFSGLFAYFYGLSIFAKDIIGFKQAQGEQLSEKDINAYKRRKVMQGLLLAMGLHAVFNIMITLDHVLFVIFQVAAMFGLLMYLLKRKTANLEFVLADKHKSVMDDPDIKIILEVLGTKYNEENYTEVIEIGNRLLKRDPDNNIARLFVTKASDRLNKISRND